MPLTINYIDQKERVITMGKADEPVADYYPPGATEPIVRPADVPAPEPAKEELPADVEEELKAEEATEEIEEAPALKGKLPDDFPGHSALQAAGITTYAKVRKSLDTLEEIDNIGPATADRIREAMDEAPEEEGEEE